MSLCGSFVCLFRHLFSHNLFSNLETCYQFCLFFTCLATCIELYIFQSQTGYHCNGCEGIVCLSSLCTAGHLVRHCAICSQGCPLGFPQALQCRKSLVWRASIGNSCASSGPASGGILMGFVGLLQLCRTEQLPCYWEKLNSAPHQVFTACG